MKKMIDSENKYEICVRKRAEELAAELHPNSHKMYIKASAEGCKMDEWSMMFYRSNWHRLINEFIPAARLSVQREAQAFAAGLQMEAPSFSGRALDEFITEQLQSLGLVPENDKPCGT